MANYHIGLDFGTSQTKVCILIKDRDSEVREFLKFENKTFFLPTLVVKKPDNTISYGDESAEGKKYRYFKMAAAEDDDLIQATFEDKHGNLEDGKKIKDYVKYSTNFELKPDILVVLYLAYIYLNVKKKYNNQTTANVGGLLGRLTGGNDIKENTFSINLGIPTEWNNPDHLKRKIKFQSLLLTAAKLSNQFNDLEDYLSTDSKVLLSKIEGLNQEHLIQIENKSFDEKSKIVNDWLKEFNLSVFPESAAGVNYLLKTKRLANGYYATLDIGAGTSDIAIFRVYKSQLKEYICSESVELASNDVYRNYAADNLNKDFSEVSFDEIKEAEYIIREETDSFNQKVYWTSLKKVRGFLNRKGLEFIIQKTFYRKYYHRLYQVNPELAIELIKSLDEQPIIIFGGGANLPSFCKGNYCYYLGADPLGNQDKNFSSKPVTDYVPQVDIANAAEVMEEINLLILALGLTYKNKSDGFNFVYINGLNIPPPPINDLYTYYDIQEAVYK